MKEISAKPILKWAGGKTKLIHELEKRYPEKLLSNERSTYIEPFIGGGAVFFNIVSKFKFEKVIINDINSELVLTYKVIKDYPEELMNYLDKKQNEFNSLSKLDEKLEYYLQVRKNFNKGKGMVNYTSINNNEIEHAAYMIFLNKSCFNGLYRENKKGEFNVPFGKKEKVNLYDRDNILRASEALSNAIILNGDFESIIKYVDENTFIYMDPPYRPLQGKGSFTDYSKEDFNDESQIRLANFCKKLNDRGAKFMQSNSDPKNTNEEDEFFDTLYKEFKIDRISASRMINSKGDGRGKISEILIMNY